jgi:hypothetical protein
VISATDVIYIVEVSDDLYNWKSGNTYTVPVGVPINNPDGITQTVIVRDLTPISLETKRFIRLRITRR